ncbi:hypothetical protein N0V83_003012 [Neocucurbitaria cava]|uniref:Uncharacterized protein n=1 Tax=Neocucurbitaria cava TaxID=798079 RepID=A0A9W8YDU0_9PLEO|nr:hypothetical protein N0V83_003012 [Neocucurbitaria cava]
MEGITAIVPGALAVSEAVATPNAVASGAEASNGDKRVAIEQGGKIVVKEPYYPEITGPQDRAPDRPLRPALQYSDLTRHIEWAEWAEQYVKQLEEKIVEGEIGRAEDKNKAAAKMAELRDEYKKRLRTARSGSVATANAQHEKEVRAALRKRENNIKVAEAKARRMQEESKTYQDLCDGIQSLGNRTETALRQMRTLTAAKNRAQAAFNRWETSFCEPNIRFLDLNRKIKEEREEIRQHHAEQMELVCDQKEQLDKLTQQKVEELASLDEQLRDLAAEKKAWRLQKGQELSELSESEQKGAMEVWMEQKIEEIKPLIMQEATKHAWSLQKPQWELQTAAALEIAEERGHKRGHWEGDKEGYVRGHKEGDEEGYARGQLDGYEKGTTDANTFVSRLIKQARSKAREGAYKEGHKTGLREGGYSSFAEGFDMGREYEEE